MEILSRSQARVFGLSQYFTGVPCRNGHLTYRYTQSGTCAGCIRSYSTAVPVDESNKLWRERLESMIQFRARVFNSDLETVRGIVLATAMMREPRVRLQDVWSQGEGINRQADTAVHKFGCFAENLESLRKTITDLFAAHCVPISQVPAIRQRILDDLERAAK